MSCVVRCVTSNHSGLCEQVDTHGARPTVVPRAPFSHASSAAEVRQAFFDFCFGEVPKKEVGLRLAREGFSEENAVIEAA